MKLLLLLTILLSISCTNGGISFLGLKTGTTLDEKLIENPSSHSLGSFYQIEYRNSNFESVSVALTRPNKEETSEGMSFKNNEIIWGMLFVDRKQPCSNELFQKILEEAKINDSYHVLYTSDRNVLYKDFYRKVNYWKDGIFYSIDCGRDMVLFEVMDYNILKENAASEGTRKIIFKYVEKMEKVSKRKL